MISVACLLIAGASAVTLPSTTLRSRPRVAELRHSRVSMLSEGASTGGGGMVDGARIGPPPDMPSLLLNNRIVYLGMPINNAVAELIISELLYLQYDSTEKPITMYINSPGTTTEDGMPVGFESEAFAIADTMMYIKPDINTVLVGKAYGLAAMLLACGKKGQRSALPYGTVMLHQPRGQQAQGQASDIAIKAREVLNNRQTALEITSKVTGVPIDKLQRDTNRCLYLDAFAAKEYGIIDKVVEKIEKGAPKEVLSALSRGLG